MVMALVVVDGDGGRYTHTNTKKGEKRRKRGLVRNLYIGLATLVTSI